MRQREGFVVGEACEWSRVSRAGFYRAFSDHAPREADTVVRDLIQKFALENRIYGYRRISADSTNSAMSLGC